MKKGICLFFLFIFCVPAFSQQRGISAHVVALVPDYDNEMEMYNSFSGLYVHHKNVVCPGIRLEGNSIRKDGFPVSVIKGLGITYIIPFLDSAQYILVNKGGSPFYVYRGQRRSSMVNLSLRFGYEIPQSFNEFLTITLGFGGGALTSRGVYLVPPPTPNGYVYTKDDFDPKSLGPHWDMTANFEGFTGIIYEFEKYSAIVQYSYSYSFSAAREGYGLLDAHNRHQFSVGIFYPLKQS
jgi:hypothetical protein